MKSKTNFSLNFTTLVFIFYCLVVVLKVTKFSERTLILLIGIAFLLETTEWIFTEMTIKK